MKITHFFVLSLILLTNSSLSAQKVMTYNLRYNTPNDGDNWWENRKEEVVEMLQYYHPDFLGVQEALKNQVGYIDEKLLKHAFIGVGRDDGKEQGEYAAIFYDSTKYTLIETQTFWLSETPDTVSVGWNASMERIVTYGAFESKYSKYPLHIFNAHYDHIGDTARLESSKLILKIIKEKNLEEEALIFMGDLNAQPDDPPIEVLQPFLDDCYSSAEHPPYGPIGTFNGFDPNFIPDRRIDYIFSKNVIVQSYRVIDDRRANNLCLSDHLPVFVKMISDF